MLLIPKGVYQLLTEWQMYQNIHLLSYFFIDKIWYKETF